MTHFTGQTKKIFHSNMNIKEILEGYKPSEKVEVVERETKKIRFYGTVEQLLRLDDFVVTEPKVTIIKSDIKIYI